MSIVSLKSQIHAVRAAVDRAHYIAPQIFGASKSAQDLGCEHLRAALATLQKLDALLPAIDKYMPDAKLHESLI